MMDKPKNPVSSKNQKAPAKQTSGFNYKLSDAKKQTDYLINKVAKAEAEGGDLADVLNATIPESTRMMLSKKK